MTHAEYQASKPESVDRRPMMATLGLVVEIWPDGRMFDVAGVDVLEITAEHVDDVIDYALSWQDARQRDADADMAFLRENAK